MSLSSHGNGGGTVRLVALVALVALASACKRDDVADADAVAGVDHPIRDPLRACAAADAGATPGSIAQVIDRFGALPSPVGAPCFLASLPRPLAVVATISVTSAQPSGGPHDPRIFVMLPDVTVGVVPAGPGAPFIEIGEWVTDTTTIKAEIALPVTPPLGADPFKHLEDQREAQGTVVTSCGFCHTPEAAHPTIQYAYMSKAFQPRTMKTLEDLQAEHRACVTNNEVSDRCDMYHALFDFGEVTQGAFPSDTAYFGQ